jgi:hypothetical protein
MAWARGDRVILENRLSRQRVLHVSTLISSFKLLAGFRPQQLAVTIHTAPAAIDKPHGVSTHGTVRRRSLVDDRELREFTTFIFIH